MIGPTSPTIFDQESWESKVPPPKLPPPPINKALLRDYENPLVSLNQALFLGGGYLRFPLIRTWSVVPKGGHSKSSSLPSLLHGTLLGRASGVGAASAVGGGGERWWYKV